MTRLGLIALLSVAASLTAGCSAPEPADLIVHGGRVLTVDDSFSVRSAVAIRDGQIIATGGEELLRRFRAPRVIDARGHTVMPGFDDTHIHIRGESPRFIDLAGVASIERMQGLVREKAKALGAGQWITGYGWSEDELAEHRRPVRGDLDAAAPDNPVVLLRAGGHSSVSNSTALKLAGITHGTPDPEHGIIEHDEHGEPTGIIRERSDLVEHLVPAATSDEVRPSLEAHLRRLLSFGITSIVQAGVPVHGENSFDDWSAVYGSHGAELPRASVQILWSDSATLKQFGKVTGEGDERLRVGALKLFVDGGFTGPAAYTLQPYKGQPNYRGRLTLSPDSLQRVVTIAHGMGWQMGFHTIGDGAIALAVSSFDRALQAVPRADHRHYVNHFSMLPPETTLATMARDHILIVQQPNFTYTLEGRYLANLDSARVVTNNPLATPMRHGVFMAFSSDILPIGPLVGIYAAVTRRGKSGAVYGANERVSLPEAVRAYTRSGAFITREEKIKGTLEPGRLADLIILSDDLLGIPPEQILKLTVQTTILGGRVVYESASPSLPP